MYFDAVQNRPCLILFDDIDKLLPPASDNDFNSNNRLNQISEIFIDFFTNLISYNDGLSSSDSYFGTIAVLGTSSTLFSIFPSLLSPPLFCNIVNISPPTASDRVSIFKTLLSKVNARVDFNPDIVAECDGYLSSDLKILVQRITHQAAQCAIFQFNKNDCVLKLQDFEVSRFDFVPSTLRDINLTSSLIGWDDIGGLADVKKMLKDTLEMPNKYEKLFDLAPIKLRSGILLYGPPGCGKTILASAVAKECGLHFISVKGPELLSKYIGSSEAAVREIFDKAAAASPCIVFFDEFEAIAPRRGGDSTGVTDRVVNQLLCYLDGVEGRKGVYVLSATSRPDLIDPALLRPGRLDKHLYCGFPNRNERFEILQAICRKLKLSSSNILLDIADLTENYTGADLQGLITNAQLLVVHDIIDEDNQKLNSMEGITYFIFLFLSRI